MRKELKGAIIGLFLSCLLCTSVKAQEIYYTNELGVEMSELEYNKMSKLFSENYIKSVLTQDMFDKYKEANIKDSQTLYQKSTYKRTGELVEEEYVTEQEFLNAPSAEVSINDGITPYTYDDDHFETAYKRLSATLVDYGNNDYSLIGALSWKKVPITRSYDVFAYRSVHFTFTSFCGSQTYYADGASATIHYNTSSPGYKAQGTGAGVSMNLVDGSNITGYDLAVATDLYVTAVNIRTAYAFMAYEHAQQDVTRAQSMAYTLDISGYGGVVKFNSDSIASKYDGMQGLLLKSEL